MNITSSWPDIVLHFTACFRSNYHVSIATVDADNCPVVTPVGSLFLNDDQTGYYFEKYLTSIPRHAAASRNICVLGVNSSAWFWLKSLYRGEFQGYPAIRLFGTLGNKRQATPEEVARLRHRVRRGKGLKGHAYLWSRMGEVREVTFTRAESVNLGAMTAKLNASSRAGG